METKEIKQPTVSTPVDLVQQITDTTPLIKLNKLTTSNTNVPTHTPSGFQDQFYFQGSTLWVYMSGTWVSVGGSVQVANGYAQAPSTTSNQTVTVGFRPKLIKITVGFTDGSYSGESVGSATSTTTEQCVYSYWNGSKIVFDHTESFIIVAPCDTGGSYKCVATLDSISDTGFTLYFGDVTVRPTYHWEAIG